MSRLQFTLLFKRAICGKSEDRPNVKNSALSSGAAEERLELSGEAIGDHLLLALLSRNLVAEATNGRPTLFHP